MYSRLAERFFQSVSRLDWPTRVSRTNSSINRTPSKVWTSNSFFLLHISDTHIFARPLTSRWSRCSCDIIYGQKCVFVITSVFVNNLIFAPKLYIVNINIRIECNSAHAVELIYLKILVNKVRPFCRIINWLIIFITYLYTFFFLSTAWLNDGFRYLHK